MGLLVLSAAVLPGESSQFTARMTAGCVMAMVGFCLYSNAKIVAARRGGPGGGKSGAARETAPETRRADVEEGEPLLQVRACC